MHTQSQAPAAALALTPAEHRAIETFYAAWQHHPDLLHEACAPDWQDIPLGPGQGPGPEGLAAIIRQFTAVFPDVKIIVHEVFGTHERAGVRAEITFTNWQPVPGVPAGGHRVVVPLHEFHYLHHGKLTHTWHLEDGDFRPYVLFAAQAGV